MKGRMGRGEEMVPGAPDAVVPPVDILCIPQPRATHVSLHLFRHCDARPSGPLAGVLLRLSATFQTRGESQWSWPFFLLLGPVAARSKCRPTGTGPNNACSAGAATLCSSPSRTFQRRLGCPGPTMRTSPSHSAAIRTTRSTGPSGEPLGGVGARTLVVLWPERTEAEVIPRFREVDPKAYDELQAIVAKLSAKQAEASEGQR